jgi:hypothetical protein
MDSHLTFGRLELHCIISCLGVCHLLVLVFRILMSGSRTLQSSYHRRTSRI